MQNSDLYIEAFARSKLGLVKQGEEFIPNKDLQSNEPN
jgi:cell division protein FtsB